MSSGLILRDYQEKDVERIRHSFRSGKRAPLFVGPCGYGKTTVFSYIAESAVKRGTQVLALCHRKELIEQISTALRSFGVSHEIVDPEHAPKRGASAYVASVFSLARHLDLCDPGLVIVDEAHHTATTTTWGRILQAYPKARRLGVTATPTRMSGEGLKDFFDDLIIGATYEELTHAGYLTPIEAWAPPSIDTANMRIRGGDFLHSDVVSRSDRPSVTGDAIEHYKRIAPGRRAIVFDVSVDSAQRRAEMFRAAGFSAHSIDGNLSSDVRRAIIDSFRSGYTQVLTSCDLVSEGFDLPAIEVGICLRPTRSLSLWIQQAGRILRPYEGKTNAILLDHAKNIDFHGLPNEQRDWTLESGLVKRIKGNAGLRLCLHCFSVNRAGAKVCAHCGEAFPREPRTVSQKKGKLEKLTPEELQKRKERRTRGYENFTAQSYQQLVALGRQRGYANPEGWADHIVAARVQRGSQV